MHNLNININAQGKHQVSFVSDGNIHSIQLNRHDRGAIRIYSQQSTNTPVLLAEYPPYTVSNYYGKFYIGTGYTVIIESDVEIYAAWEDVVTVANSTTEPLPANVQQAVTNLQKLIDEIKGNEGSTSATTPKIDSDKEIHSFLEGFENDQKLKDVLNDVEQPLTDEEMASLTAMFPTS